MNLIEPVLFLDSRNHNNIPGRISLSSKLNLSFMPGTDQTFVGPELGTNIGPAVRAINPYRRSITYTISRKPYKFFSLQNACLGDIADKLDFCCMFCLHEFIN